jgi:hypothetical protein
LSLRVYVGEGILFEHESRPRRHPGENFKIPKLEVRLIEN